MNAPADDPDNAAVLAAARGDQAAFGALFRRLGPGAWTFAKRMSRDAASAEDAVHEAFLRLFEAARRGVFDPARGTARALLIRMVRNACVDSLRRRSREDASLEGVDRARPDGASAVGLSVDASQLLATLPETWRSALFLRIDQGLSYDEIAVALGATLGQVKTWIFRARTALAERLAHPALAEGGRSDL
jgi:RNA polymerase sigma-70 factor (ECF subfamily)